MDFFTEDQMRKRRISSQQRKIFSELLKEVPSRILRETMIDNEGLCRVNVRGREFQNRIVSLVEEYSGSEACEEFIMLNFGDEIALFEANFQPA